MHTFETLKIAAFGDSAILIKAGDDISIETHRIVRRLMLALNAHKIEGIDEMIPSYNELLIMYNPLITAPEVLADAIREANLSKVEILHTSTRLVSIPVLYGGAHGVDIQEVAHLTGLSTEEVVAIHSRPNYPVYMMGFMPGFCYLGGMDPRIACNRKAQPRLRINAGSVGIAGHQTGIYPIDSPGGWQIIGQTPVQLFRPNSSSPFLVKAGDYIRFEPIDRVMFDELKNEDSEPVISEKDE